MKLIVKRNHSINRSLLEYEDREVTSQLGVVSTYRFPPAWSLNACSIFAGRYMRKADIQKHKKVIEYGVPPLLQRSVLTDESTFETYEPKPETSASAVFHRLAGCWAYWGLKEGYFDEKNAVHYYHEMTCILYDQRGAPNSPQWFNTGLNWAYGITGKPQGHYYFDTLQNRVIPSVDAYSRPQPHACFIQSVEDNLVSQGGILDLVTKEARLFKYGSGTGTNFSSIRAEGESLSGGGTSSGLMSFLKVGDTSAGAIKSGGTTRRAAKMVCLDVDHPEIEAFIDWKMEEEGKVASLIAGSKLLVTSVKKILKESDPKKKLKLIRKAIERGVPEHCILTAISLQEQKTTFKQFEYDNGWGSKAYETVSGQNSNNSIRVSDDFMSAVLHDDDWHLINRNEKALALKENRTPLPAKIVRAQDLFDKICYSSWICADPALQFEDTINDANTCPLDGKINASNPCSEYMFLDDTACNLASMNLVKYETDKDEDFIDYEKFQIDARLWTITLDISVQMAQFPSKEIAQGSWDYRTLGLGFANLGALIMRKGCAYDDIEATDTASLITLAMQKASLKASIEMGKLLGSFPRFEKNRYNSVKVNARQACIKESEITHLRNAQLTVIAPTGTIALIMDCDTTGIEPDFALVKHKTLAGGGSMKIVNQSVPLALKTLGYSPDKIKEIEDYIIDENNETIEGAPHIKDYQLEIFDCANKSGQGVRFIDPQAHLNMMQASQPHLSGAISKTVNIPSNATIKDIEQIYIQAWRMKIKSVALYRDQSKLAQPLTSKAGGSLIESCKDCGNESLRQNGTCKICEKCGSTTGCS